MEIKAGEAGARDTNLTPVKKEQEEEGQTAGQPEQSLDQANR